MSSQQEILQDLRDCVLNFEIERVREVVIVAVKAGIEPYVAVTEGLSKGMDIVSERYEAGEYFLSDLVMAGETMKAAMEVLEPHLKMSTPTGAFGTVVIGTVEGDLHDLGKGIVVTLLSSAGFQVTDLGVDVSPESFLSATREKKPDILAMSSLLTTTMPNIKKTIRLLEDKGLRDSVKIIVGGAPLSSEFADEVGADAYGKDAVEALGICRKWIRAKSGGK